MVRSGLPLSDAVLYHVSISKNISSDPVTHAALHIMCMGQKTDEKKRFYITHCTVDFIRLVCVCVCE